MQTKTTQTATQQNQYIKMTQTPIPKLLINLSIPTIVSMMVTNIYNLVDTAFVGTLGNSASGAVGIVFGFMSILQAIGFLFGQGAGSLMSRKLGEKNVDEATRIASTGFFSAFLLSIFVEIGCLMVLHPLVMTLGSTETIAPYAKTYIFWILIAAPFTVTSFTMNNLLRYEGKAMYGMIALMAGAVLNICGDAILIFGLHLGIAGAGISTAVSQTISFFVMVYIFISGKTQCRLALRMCRFRFSMLADITTTGFPSLLRQILNSLATIFLNTQAAPYGDAAIAALSIVSRIIFFTFSIALGIGQGFQPISAFNYGAKKYKRVKKAYWIAFTFSESILFFLTIGVFLKSGSLIHIFRNDPEVILVGTRALRLQAFAQLAIPFCMVTEMLYQSTGRKLGASLLSSMRSGIIFIPALLILAHFRGLAGIQEAQPLAFVLSLLPGIYASYLFFRELPEE